MAEYLLYLENHDEEYNSYLGHKLRSSVTNKRLIQEIEERNYDAKDRFGKSFINQFECFLCEKPHNQVQNEISIATTQHYDCEMPVSILSRRPNATNEWVDMYFYGRCEAHVVRKFIDSGVANYTIEEYNNAVIELVKRNKCSYSEKNLKDLNLKL